MQTIMITIKPHYLRYILSGAKTFELRKTCPKHFPFRVLCCESQSGGEVKGEFICDRAMHAFPEDFPDLVRDSCVSMDNALAYADGGKLYFWHISDVRRYAPRSKNISDYGIKRPPQSWQYVKALGEGREE